ncbi:MAG: hypothetical protein R2774_03730 [Saprospiraceae bacterium]
MNQFAHFYNCIEFQHRQFPMRRTRLLSHILTRSEYKDVEDFLKKPLNHNRFYSDSNTYELHSDQVQKLYKDVLFLEIPVKDYYHYNVMTGGYSVNINNKKIKYDRREIFLAIYSKEKISHKMCVIYLVSKDDFDEVLKMWPDFGLGKNIPRKIQNTLRKNNIDLVFSPTDFVYYYEEVNIFDYLQQLKSNNQK